MSLKERIKENTRELSLNDIKNQIIQSIDTDNRIDIEDFVKEHLNENCSITLDRYEREKLINDVTRELNGYGMLDNLMEDGSVTAIYINASDNIYVEKNEKVYKTKIIISNLEKIITRMAADCGKEINQINPVLEGMLPNGARITAMIPPFSKNPVLTVKKYHFKNANIDSLINAEFMNEEIGKFLTMCVRAKKNIIINGLGNSGKTTLANALTSLIDKNERIALIEDYPEFLITQDNFIRCQNTDNSLQSVMRMLPKRVIIDSCHNLQDIRDLADAGYKGIIATVTIADELGIGINNSVTVKVKQVSDGTRKIVSVSEQKEIFRYRECYIEDGKLHGEFETVSKVPKYKDEVVPLVKKSETLSDRLKETGNNKD